MLVSYVYIKIKYEALYKIESRHFVSESTMSHNL